MRVCPSPNFNERNPAVSVDYIVLHYTSMRSAQAALDRLCDPASEVSAHYLIDEDGEIFRLVDEEKRAWHAGKSFWRGIEDINSASIGIELQNPGHNFGYRPFPQRQIDALKKLLREIIEKRGLNPLRCLLGHSDVAPMRKVDPGELFPWQELAAERLGTWPTIKDKQSGTLEEAYAFLRQIGYACPAINEEACHAALRAFCRRYHPEGLDHPETPETFSRLRSLAEEDREEASASALDSDGEALSR